MSLALAPRLLVVLAALAAPLLATAQDKSTAQQYLDLSAKIEESLYKSAYEQLLPGQDSQDANLGPEYQLSRGFARSILGNAPLYDRLQLFKNQVREVIVHQSDVSGAEVREGDPKSERLWVQVVFSDNSRLAFECHPHIEFISALLSKGKKSSDGRMHFAQLEDLSELLKMYQQTNSDYETDSLLVHIHLDERTPSKYSSAIKAAVEWDRKTQLR